MGDELLDALCFLGCIDIIINPTIPVIAPMTSHLYGLKPLFSATYEVDEAKKTVYQKTIFMVLIYRYKPRIFTTQWYMNIGITSILPQIISSLRRKRCTCSCNPQTCNHFRGYLFYLCVVAAMRILHSSFGFASDESTTSFAPI